MKNLEIENLERQNIYKVPDGFFADMQENVLSGIVVGKKRKIGMRNWMYYAAAVVTLLFGVTFFVNHDQPVAESTNRVSQTANSNPDSVINSLPISKLQSEVTEGSHVNNDLTNDNSYNQKESTASNDIANVKKTNSASKEMITVPQNSDNQMDQILANFSSGDIADLAKNAEQDVYLDLYN